MKPGAIAFLVVMVIVALIAIGITLLVLDVLAWLGASILIVIVILAWVAFMGLMLG